MCYDEFWKYVTYTRQRCFLLQILTLANSWIDKSNDTFHNSSQNMLWCETEKVVMLFINIILIVKKNDS